MNLPIGKGVYVWQPQNMGDGTVDGCVRRLMDAGVRHVCFKGADERYTWDKSVPYVKAVKEAGIKVGIFHYVYLTWDAKREAQAAVRAIEMFEPEYYLIDGESQAKKHWTEAKVFMNNLVTSVPVGLNTYWFPPYHPEFPWREFRSSQNIDFDCPQMYWRGTRPIEKLYECMAAYNKMTPKLPMPLIAGDIYDEGKIVEQPTPQQVTEWLTEVNTKTDIGGVLMWAADNTECRPDLWEAFSAYEWSFPASEPPVPPVEPPVPPVIIVPSDGLDLAETVKNLREAGVDHVQAKIEIQIQG